MAPPRKSFPGVQLNFSPAEHGPALGGALLSRIDGLQAMGRQCLCVPTREEGHARLLAHALDVAEADAGLLFEVTANGQGRLIAAQGLALTLPRGEAARAPSLSPSPSSPLSLDLDLDLDLDLEFAAHFRERLGLPARTRCFEAALLGRDGPCGVLVLYWFAARDEAADLPAVEPARALPDTLPDTDMDLDPDEDEATADQAAAGAPFLERVAEQCAQGLEHLRLSWNLDQALHQLDERERHERQRRAFFGAIAHELRSPLNALRGGLKLLDELNGLGGASAGARAGSREAAQRRRAERIIEQALACQARLLDDLAALARLELGRLRMTIERCELTGLLADALDRARAGGVPSTVALHAALGQRPLFVEADAVRLAQIFDNLLANALRYTDAGAVAVSAAREGGEAVVRVEDSGLGISAERLASLFEPIWSERARFDERRGGMGLGLSVAHELTGLLGGRLTATSRGPGLGSRFEVRLPLCAAATVEVVAAEAATTAVESEGDDGAGSH